MFRNVSAANTTNYYFTATGWSGPTRRASLNASSERANLTVVAPSASPAHIGNPAIRSKAGVGADTLIVGFAIGGAETDGGKPLLVRGVGPTLGVLGVPVDPRVELLRSPTSLSANDDWGGKAALADTFAGVGAFAFTPPSKDAALFNPALAAGAYSVQVTGNGGATGVALAEVADAHWLQQLHAVGLLHASFHPPAAIRRLGTLWRQRDSLVREAARQVQLMHKALDQMNLHVDHVLSDLMGESGSRMVTAILAGERDAAVLARLRDHRVNANEATLIKALNADYRPQCFFCLQQARDPYTHSQTQTRLRPLARRRASGVLRRDRAPARLRPASRGKKDKTARKNSNQPKFDLRTKLYRVCGVDLTAVPGII